MMTPPTRTAFGAILGHPTRPHLRFFNTPGDGAGGDGGTPPASDDAPAGDETAAGDDAPLSAADAKALRTQADRRMQERNAARDEAKAYRELGLTPDQIRELVAARDAANGGPSAEQLAAKAARDAEAAVGEKFSGRARTAALRLQAAELGFHNPSAAIALIDPTEVARITVDDDYEADAAGAKKLLEALATAEPYLVKPKESATADYRTAGIGGTGGSAKPDPGPGTARMAAAYATSSPRTSSARR